MATPRLTAGIARSIALALLASTVAVAQRAVPPARSHHPDIPYQSPTSLGAASYAKVLCSAVFVSGREEDEARQNSAWVLMTEPDRAKPVVVDVNRQTRRVRVTVDKIERTAAFYGDQGCVIHPVDHVRWTLFPSTRRSCSARSPDTFKPTTTMLNRSALSVPFKRFFWRSGR
jgi:hypothetical protein